MQRFKLSNVILDADEFLSEDLDLLYRADASSSARVSTDGGLEISGLVDFTTYLGSVSTAKWVRYAAVDNVSLHLEVSGDPCTVAILSMRVDDETPGAVDVVDVVELAAGPVPVSCDLRMPLDCAIASFAVLSGGVSRIMNAFYYTEIDEERIRPIRLALCTTTFRKEEFILRNIEWIRSGVLGSGEPVSRDFHMFVVDNGRTLDSDALSHDGVTVIPNPNVGGAGGFARGMMAAQEDGADFTHVVLMDDDVRMLPESFKRLHALLSIATGGYEDAFVNGAMLQLEHPSIQFEDVSYVRRSGGYESVKPRLDVGDKQGLAQNELIDVEVENAYGAWWFSCVPMAKVNDCGLPLPFFIRCDDIEYGIRCHARYMVMNGICVWHAQFAGRFNAAIVCYQYMRNFMATVALHGCSDENLFMVQTWRTLSYYLRTMDYAAAELWLDGFEDYLKGPEFLEHADGNELVRSNGAKAEKFVPIDELDQDVVSRLEVDLEWLDGDPHERTIWEKIFVTVPHDRHWFPDFMLSSNPGALAPGSGDSYTPWRKVAMRKNLVALNVDATRGALRSIDRQRHHDIVVRFRGLLSRWWADRRAVAERWRSEMAYMTSRDFWETYLEERSEG